MKTNEYIESGILELYATNCLNKIEAEEVEEMTNKYPEIKMELVAIQESLAKFASANPKTPNPKLKSKVLNAVFLSTEKQGKIIPIRKNKSENIWRMLAAACFSLLLLSSSVFMLKLNQNEKQIDELQGKINLFSTNMNMLRSPDFMKINLKGKELAPGAVAVIHWNKENSELVLDFVNLPNPDQEHQYQLWALDNGSPVDAGVFEMGKGMLEMKKINNAQAFAVTLEPKGGSINPTLDKMYLFASL